MARIRSAIVLFVLIPLSCFAGLSEDLLDAVRKGDAARVKALLAQGADVNAKSPYGATGLFFAADRGNAEIVKILLDQGADASVKDTFYGATAMGFAAEKEHVEVIRLLLSKSVTGVDEVLSTGVEKGNLEMVRLALEHKSAIPPETLSEALAAATKENRRAVADLLKNAGVTLPAKPNFQVDPETLKSYAGAYSMDTIELKFDVIGGKLTGGAVGQKAAPFDAIDKSTFQHSEVASLKLTFNVEDGKVISVTVNQRGANPMVFKKTGAK